jgi:hypothetical protein
LQNNIVGTDSVCEVETCRLPHPPSSAVCITASWHDFLILFITACY